MTVNHRIVTDGASESVAPFLNPSWQVKTVLNTPFSPWPSFTEEEANSVRDVVLSNKVNYWTGQECRAFEKEFAAWASTEYAVALANGTVR